MIREIHTFEIECDTCHARERYEASVKNDIPDGWVSCNVPLYDSYGYRSESLCPVCAAVDADSLVSVT